MERGATAGQHQVQEAQGADGVSDLDAQLLETAILYVRLIAKKKGKKLSPRVEAAAVTKVYRWHARSGAPAIDEEAVADIIDLAAYRARDG